MRKRALDIIVGSLALVLLAPVMLVVAIGLATSLRCWPLFRQRRVGQDGQQFVLIKLRTLPRTTPPYCTKNKLEVEVPRFARFVRRKHLDELPQLFHVVTGRMSLVGPRPRMPHEFEPVDAAYSRARETVPQGCTGLWQISEDIHLLPNEAPDYDLLYVEHPSARIDIVVLFRTVLIILGLSDRLSLDQVRELVARHASEPARARRTTRAAVPEASARNS